MERVDIALLLSGGSLLVSAASFLWNVRSKDRPKVQITVRRGLDMRFGGTGIPSLIIEVANTGQKPIGIKFPARLLLEGSVGLGLDNRDQYEGWPDGGRLIEHDKFVVYVPRQSWRLREGTTTRHGFEVLVEDFSGRSHLANVSPDIQRWLDDYVLNK